MIEKIGSVIETGKRATDSGPIIGDEKHSAPDQGRHSGSTRDTQTGEHCRVGTQGDNIWDQAEHQ